MNKIVYLLLHADVVQAKMWRYMAAYENATWHTCVHVCARVCARVCIRVRVINENKYPF